MGIGIILVNFSVILFIVVYADTAISSWTNPVISTKDGNGTATGGAIPEDIAAGTVTKIQLATTDAATGFAITAPTDGPFTIFNNGSIKCDKGKLDYEKQSSYVITVVADNTATASVTLSIGDVNDNAPVFSKAPFHATMADGAKKGTGVINVKATDADGTKPNNIIKAYSLKAGNNTNGDFAINTTSGAITVEKTLNATRTKNYVLVVEAADNGSPSITGTANVNICVGDCGENGVATPAIGFVTIVVAVFLRLMVL